MKESILILFSAFILSSQAATNHVAEVRLLSIGKVSYTNCTVRYLNPAEAVIWQGGRGSKHALADLPPDLQKQFHYSEAAAEKFLEERTAKAAAIKQAEAERAARAQALKAQQAQQLAEQKKQAEEASRKRWEEIRRNRPVRVKIEREPNNYHSVGAY